MPAVTARMDAVAVDKDRRDGLFELSAGPCRHTACAHRSSSAVRHDELSTGMKQILDLNHGDGTRDIAGWNEVPLQPDRAWAGGPRVLVWPRLGG